MFSHIAIFLLGLVLLAKGADFFVEYAGRLAKRFGVSDFLIGLTLTSIGTSIPEFAASLTASLNDASGLVIGNVMGSNIANIGLILGISAMLKSFKTEQKMYNRDGFFMIASAALFFAFALDNEISTGESIFMLVGYLFYVLFLIESDQESRVYHFQDFMKYVFDFEYISPLKDRLFKIAIRKPQEQRTPAEQKEVRKYRLGILKDLAIILVSGAAIMFGARYLVREAIWLAELLHVPESVIGISLMAIGTSLPELSVAISAVRKGKGEMIVGNVVGSNIANILLIVGSCGLVTEMKIAEISVVYTIPIMLFFSIGLLYFIKTDWTIKRSQGIISVIAYVVFMVLAFVMGWS
jgi:cation:H+ antiporter